MPESYRLPHLGGLASSEAIGFSEEGRPLHVHFLGAATAPLRVLILGGQHGDEGRSRRAVERYAEAPAVASSPNVSVALIPNLNPDGAARKQRCNARGIDLNRDHQLLAAAETRALHQFVRAWRPHLIVDVHVYPPRRKRLLACQMVHCHDVFLDVPNNPSLAPAILDQASPRFLASALADLNEKGYRCGRYVLSTPAGKARHSTADVIDARNGLALRYGIPVFLIEGRKPMPRDDAADRLRLRAALQKAIESSVNWADRNGDRLTSQREDMEFAAIRSRRVRAEAPCTMHFQDARTGTIRMVEVPGVYYPSLRITRRVRIPVAYAVPRTHAALIDVLHRHGFASRLGPIATELVEYYRFKSRERPGHSARLKVEMVTADRSLADHMLFSVTRENAHALSVFLEPRSNYSLCRYKTLLFVPDEDSFHPILRILNKGL